MTMDDHLFLVAYDIKDAARWRRVFKLLRGYGEWLQLSVFQCRLSHKRHTQLVGLLDEMINHDEDHVIVVDVGLAATAKPRVTSLGREFRPVEREPIIV